MKGAALGILLLAHGGDPSWNADVDRLRAAVDAKIPAETSLGMADVASLQAAVDRLQKRGVSRIVAVPLFVQSRSEVLDQTRYALGLADKPSEVLRRAYAHYAHGHGAHGGHGAGHGHSMEFSLKKVKSAVPLSMSDALDDHPLVGRILLERARALSRAPKGEDVVLVAHGPVDDAAMPAWEGSMRSLCAQVAAGGFRDCSFFLLRDDAPPKVRAAAVAGMRARVSRAKGEKARALVVPVLIARGGIEKKISVDLAGLDYAWDGKTLMPHDGFDAWVLERAGVDHP